MAKLPLEHLTALDLTLHRAGPTCARQFADWGAKVIKIEVPGGPNAKRSGVAPIAPGMGRLMSITGKPGRGPIRVGIPIADVITGLFLFQACLLALMLREQTDMG